jgi:holo-[acyl-carrier protein] synthase
VIVGIGVDILEISRLERSLERYGKRFLDHVFTDSEQVDAPSDPGVAVVYYAGRWCVKEAVSKALGTGIGAKCNWRDIVVMRSDSGMPVVALNGAAECTAQEKQIARWHVSISHEKHNACAFVVAESV